MKNKQNNTIKKRDFSILAHIKREISLSTRKITNKKNKFDKKTRYDKDYMTDY